MGEVAIACVETRPLRTSIALAPCAAVERLPATVIDLIGAEIAEASFEILALLGFDQKRRAAVLRIDEQTGSVFNYDRWAAHPWPDGNAIAARNPCCAQSSVGRSHAEPGGSLLYRTPVRYRPVLRDHGDRPHGVRTRETRQLRGTSPTLNTPDAAPYFALVWAKSRPYRTRLPSTWPRVGSGPVGE